MTHTMKFPINNLRLLYKTYVNVCGGEQESGAQEGAAVSALTAQERRRTRGGVTMYPTTTANCTDAR